MQKQIVTLVSCLLSVILPLKASAQNFEGFFIFGDSLVDNGNLFNLTRGRIPPIPPYFNGRFSNGPVWVEILGSKLGISASATNNFAFGGATSGTFNALSPLVGISLPGGLALQINSFTTSPVPSSSKALYVLWAGANDYIVLPPQLRTTDTTAVVNNLANAITAITAKGGQNIVVVNIPDLGKTPQERLQPTASSLTNLIENHNTKLNLALQGITQNRNLKIFPIDAYALFNEVIAEPARYGFTNVTESCFNQAAGTLCSNPNQYLFWDGIHPTAAAHNLIGEYAYAVLNAPQSVVPQTSIALNVARRQTQSLDTRLLALRSLSQTPSTPRTGVFIEGDLNFGEKDNNATEKGYEFANTGINVGVDYRVNNNVALGVAIGYTANNTTLNNNLGKVQIDSYGVSAYTSFAQENFYANGVVSYGQNSFNISRKTNFANRTATANPDGEHFSVAVNTGYNIKTSNASFGPTVGLRYNQVNIDSYTEKNAGSLNMKVKSQEAESLVLSLGAQASVAINAGQAKVIPQVRVSYEHELADDSREIVTELVSQPGIPMRANTAKPDRDYVKLGVGTQVQFSDNFSGAIDYETVIGRENFSDQAVKAEVRFQF